MEITIEQTPDETMITLVMSTPEYAVVEALAKESTIDKKDPSVPMIALCAATVQLKRDQGEKVEIPPAEPDPTAETNRADETQSADPQEPEAPEKSEPQDNGAGIRK